MQKKVVFINPFMPTEEQINKIKLLYGTDAQILWITADVTQVSKVFTENGVDYLETGPLIIPIPSDSSFVTKF